MTDPMPLHTRIELGVLDAATVASLLDCEAATVQSRAAAGDLPAVKYGRS